MKLDKMSIAMLIKSADDADLCDEIDSRISLRYGSDVELKKIPEYERAVLLIWSCSGIIGNGGFQYLLEAPYEGDPRLKLAYRAFEMLGCKPALEAFRKTFAVFPDGFPPANIERRMNLYLKAMRKSPTDEDMIFFKVPIEKPLAEFIRKHSKYFLHLDPVPEKKPAKPKAPPEVKEEKREPDKMEQLPLWMRRAFAVYLAKEVFPLLKKHWPKISEKYYSRVQQALEVAEEALFQTVAEDTLRVAKRNCTMTAGGALMMEAAGPDAPADGILAHLAANVAKTVEAAVEISIVTPKESAQSGWRAWGHATSSIPKAKRKRFVKVWSEMYYGLLDYSKKRLPKKPGKLPPDFWKRLEQFMLESGE